MFDLEDGLGCLLDLLPWRFAAWLFTAAVAVVGLHFLPVPIGVALVLDAVWLLLSAWLWGARIGFRAK